MEVKKERRIHNVLSNLFYYSFILLTLAILILSLIIPDSDMILNILFISLLVASLVIVFYLAVQFLRYNISVDKKTQLGVLLVVIGFILVLASLSRQITLGEISSFLGTTFFAAWGIGSIVVGIIIEISFLDQWLWDRIKGFFEFLWRIVKKVWDAFASLLRFIREHWWPILKEFLRIAASVGWGIIVWYLIDPRLLLNMVSGWIIMGIFVFEVLTRRIIWEYIWKAIRFVAVDVIYRFFYNAVMFIKNNWKKILAEITRLIVFALGVAVIVITFLTLWIFTSYYYFALGAGLILIGQVFSRRAVWRYINIHRVASVRTIGLILIAIGFILELFVDRGEWKLSHVFTIALGSFLVIFARIIIEPILVWRFIKAVGRLIKRISIAIYNFFKKHWLTILKEFLRIVGAISGILLYVFTREITPFSNIGGGHWALIIMCTMIFFEVFTRKFILIALWNTLKNIVKGIWDFIVIISEAIWDFIKKIWNFIKKHWKRVLQETARIAAAVIIGIVVNHFYYGGPGFKFLIFASIITVCLVFTRIRVLRAVWKAIRFIAVDIFYRFFYNIGILIRDIAKGIWNRIVAIARFIRDHWKTFLKELARVIGAAIGVWCIIVYAGTGDFGLEIGVGLRNSLIWIGILVILICLIFSRIAVLRFIYRNIKSFAKTLFKHRAKIFRVFGLISVVCGVVISISKEWGIVSSLTVSIGGIFLVFAHWILHPKKFWEFLKRIPVVIRKIFRSIWITIKTISIYIYENFIRIILLLTMIISVIYGTALVVGKDFFTIFPGDISYGILASIGGGLIIVASVAFILLRREFKKLRTGTSRALAKDLKEVWIE